LLIALGNIHPMADDRKTAAGAGNPAFAVLARDAALARISRTRRWVIAAAAALTAALAALASALLPGKSLGAKTAGHATTTRSSTGTPALPVPASAAQLGLEGPSSTPQSSPAPQPAAPQPAPAPAPSGGGGAVVSGGS
jgi:hypothetical protein